VAGKRRRFGYVRKLPSGRYQASFIGPSGLRQSAPTTFKTRTDADRWLTAVEADIARGAWLDEGVNGTRILTLWRHLKCDPLHG